MGYKVGPRLRETRLLARSGRGRTFTQPTPISVCSLHSGIGFATRTESAFVRSPSCNPQQHPSFIFFFSRLNRRGFHFLNWRQIAVGGNKRSSGKEGGGHPCEPSLASPQDCHPGVSWECVLAAARNPKQEEKEREVDRDPRKEMN